MRKEPRYNDKDSRSSNHHWGMGAYIDFETGADYWPCPLFIVPTKPGANKTALLITRTADSRSGLKGITIRQRMGKI